jgi:hypothetical protein
LSQEAAAMKVWIYTDTSKKDGDPERFHDFASEEAAHEWFKDNDPEGRAFEYPVKTGEPAD